MASLDDVFTEPERTNLLKVWLAIDIAKSGLEQFVENEAKTLHGNIYNAIWSSVPAPVACCGCQTANLLKCPSPGICNKRGTHGVCTSMHDIALKLPRPCPANVCDKVRDEIAKQHTFSKPSWKNTFANHWASSPWQIAKAFLPPDGYIGKSSVQDTDFNGIISFMMNCKHFDTMFSFHIAPGKAHPPCLLTKARDIGRTLRHTSTCKVTDTDLQDIFITLISLLTDPTCLAHDIPAQEAVKKLAKLQTDVLKLTTEEIVQLIESAKDELKKVETINGTAIEEMQTYIENCRKDLGKLKQELSEHTVQCKQKLDEHGRKSTISYYEQSCKDFRRRLIAHYNDTSSNVPLSNLDQSLDKRIADIYATPKIHRIEIENDGKRVKKEQALTYNQIFYTCESSDRRIYLQGEPGSGKSTFSAKLVHDWSNGNQASSTSPIEEAAFDDVSTIEKFKYLFFITLRDCRGQTDVTQMIKKQLIDKTFSEDERADVYKLLVLIMNKERCLVVREGRDEWVSPDGSNLAEPSMAGFQSDTCTVLTTSRPWKLSDERIKNSHIDSLLEIEGICEPNAFSENILRCIINQTMDLKETLEEFESFVEDHELKWLSSSPMLYTLVICTWVNTIEDENDLKGSSLCELYTTLLESLCKMANSATGYFNNSNPPPVQCFSNTSYLEPNIEHLNKLAEVAFTLLFSSERESSIVFNDIILSKYFSPHEFTVRKTFALKAGILTNRKDKSRTGSANSFVHKTVQELLAAYHIACNPYVIDDVISRYLERNSTSYLEISQVLIFLSGMNIVAANKLSALMNQCHITDCDFVSGYPCEFQRIIVSGIKEAAANNQDDIQLKLSHFCIDESNIRDFNYIWATNTSNIQGLYVKIDKRNFLSSPTRCEPTTHFEFNLSSCNSLTDLKLSGNGIWLRETASSATSELPVWIVLNSEDPTKCTEPTPVLPSIEYMELERVTCTSSGLRSLFNTLLTLDHEVKCYLNDCYITSCADGICIGTDAEATGVNNELNMLDLVNDSPGLWEALRGLTIKSLSLSKVYGCLKVNHLESLSQSLASLKQLETLSIGFVYDSPGLWEALRGLTIKSFSLSSTYGGLTVNHVESFSQSLASLKQLETLSIGFVYDCPGLWEALLGLTIKSLSLRDDYVGLTVNHVESLSQSLASLKQLETLSISVGNNSTGLWEALRGLNIMSLSLSDSYGGFTLDHDESFSQSLASLRQLETLSISVGHDRPGLWEALRGLNIKCLSLMIGVYGGLTVNHVESLSLCLASLKKLETLTLYVYTYINIQLPQSLQYLNISCCHMPPSELRELLNTMSACTKKVKSRLNFGCGYNNDSNYEPIPPEEYIAIQQKLDELKNVKVKRFRISERAASHHKWSVREFGVVDDDNQDNDSDDQDNDSVDQDNDSDDNKEFNEFLSYMDPVIINHISMRLQIIPALMS